MLALPEHLQLLRECLPAVWDPEHVGLRLTEAFKTVRLLPTPRPRGHRSSWPAYAYEFQDLLAQQETSELERTQRLQNAVRRSPSLSEITAMERATAWPAAYLADCLDLAHAVNAVSMAHAFDRDCDWVVRRYGGYADSWRVQHARGCTFIAEGLRRDRISVF
jgi:hypothetical protein